MEFNVLKNFYHYNCINSKEYSLKFSKEMALILSGFDSQHVGEHVHLYPFSRIKQYLSN